MRDHAIVSPLFWSGHTGQQLRKEPDVQRLAIYLITCPSSNMIGLYYLPIPTISHELGMSEEKVRKALQRGVEIGFCDYDAPSEVVFVKEMARFQCGKTLKPRDNRRYAVEKLLATHRKCRLYNDFLKRYAQVYDLAASPLEGGSPPAPQEKDQDQEKEKEQDGKTPPPPVPAEPPDPIPPELQTKAFRAAWETWKMHRRQIRKPLTPLSVSQQFKILANMGESRAVAAIIFSISKGYQGIFEPKRSDTHPESLTDQIQAAGRQFLANGEGAE